jgi:hypothetical protein
MKQVVVHKGRTVILPVSLGFDVSQDIFTSEIRVEEDSLSVLIATWIVSFETNGVDGELILRLDNSVTSLITKSVGYMDLKRVTGGEPVPVFDEPLEVLFKDTVTV